MKKWTPKGKHQWWNEFVCWYFARHVPVNRWMNDEKTVICVRCNKELK